MLPEEFECFRKDSFLAKKEEHQEKLKLVQKI